MKRFHRNNKAGEFSATSHLKWKLDQNYYIYAGRSTAVIFYSIKRMSKQQESSLPPSYEDLHSSNRATPPQENRIKRSFQLIGDRLHTGGCLLLQSRNVYCVFNTIGIALSDTGEKISRKLSSSTKHH
ncbi:hypothetical protein BCR42DRAFT_467813 [Absidia repens]|uniref:Uncharacterized protein n=1 Tax=Absidia repens TaxID=90262 RepID=A0A1X2IAA6_9FUNG|nr:hypothetical protein BCR42DRAFT_467813 [Absidia repens]